ncbi:hypothetical protein [Novosphingobium sp. 11B]
MTGIAKLVAGGLMDGQCQKTGGRIGLLSGVKGQSFEVQRWLRHHHPSK